MKIRARRENSWGEGEMNTQKNHSKTMRYKIGIAITVITIKLKSFSSKPYRELCAWMATSFDGCYPATITI